MEHQQTDVDRDTTLQAVRASIRARSLSRLQQAMDRPWAQKVLFKYQDAVPTAEYRIFKAALKDMQQEERKKAFQWTWDCYHPFMSDLGKCLEDMDGYVRGQRL